MRNLFTLFLFFCNLLLFSQSRKIDSLKTVLKFSKEDTAKVNSLNRLAKEYNYRNPDTCIYYSSLALSLAQKLKYEIGLGQALMSYGWGSYMKGDYSSALDNYTKALDNWDRLEKTFLKDDLLTVRRAKSKTFTFIGLVYSSQGDYSKSLEYYFKSLKIGEELKDKNLISTQQANIAVLYRDINQPLKAEEYFLKALRTAEDMKDRNKMASIMGNMGLLYFDMQDYSKALQYDYKALEISEGRGEKTMSAIIYSNIGGVYQTQAKYETSVIRRDSLFNTALDYFFKAQIASEEVGDRANVARNFGNIGATYIYLKKYTFARKYLEMGLLISKEIYHKENLMYRYSELAMLDSAEGNYKGSLDNYKLFILYRDSISNEENTKKETQTEMQYFFDKKQSTDSISNAERIKRDNLKHEQEINQQKIYSYGGAIGFILMLLVALISYRAFRNKQKSNYIIELQKRMVEEKQKDILDSIHYAKRIQLSMMPNLKNLDKKIDRLKSGALME